MRDLFSLKGEAFVVEERGEVEGMSAPAVHFVREDDQPGGPWPYWNEEMQVGASRG